MAVAILILVAIAMLMTFVGFVTWVDHRDDQAKAAENPKYDPEMVKFLAENGLSQQQIIATMERRNIIK